jgi:hypothetical protein
MAQLDDHCSHLYVKLAHRLSLLARAGSTTPWILPMRALMYHSYSRVVQGIEIPPNEGG